MIEHRHFSTGKMEKDKTTNRNRDRNQFKIDEDRYAALINKRFLVASKLSRLIAASTDLEYTKDHRLRDILTGKRVALVGPSRYLTGKKLGALIDEYDIVCRVNEAFPFGMEEDYGYKTDVIFHATSPTMMRNLKKSLEANEFRTSQLQFLVGCQTSPTEGRTRAMTAAAFNQDFKLKMQHVDTSFWQGINKMLGCTPNSGVVAMFTLLQYPLAELFITGFSFYVEGQNVELCHHDAYMEFGGEDNKKLPMSLHKQEPQIEAFKDFIVEKNRNIITVDSHMNEVLDLNYDKVVDLEGLDQHRSYLEHWEPLRKYFEGKRVAVVGPSPHLLGKRIGELIDKYDIVCRVNEVFPWGLEKDYGSRTDVIFHCCGTDSMQQLVKSLKKDPDRTNKIKMMICPQKGGQRNFSLINNFNIPFFYPGDKWWYKAASDIDVINFPNTGVISLALLNEFDLKELFITGFNFYSQGLESHKRHHPAYIENGGDTHNEETSEVTGQQEIGFQEQQMIWLKRYCVMNKKNVVVDSTLEEILELKQKKTVKLHNSVYAVYRVLYGADFVQESIKSILPYVDKVFVFWTNKPFGDSTSVIYKGERVQFPEKVDDIVEQIQEMQKENPDKIELMYDHWGMPDNQVTHLVNDRIIPYFPKPNVVVFMEPDMVWSKEQIKAAMKQFQESGDLCAGSRQVEMWKNLNYRIPERDRFGAIFYNMNGFFSLPETGKNGSVKDTKKLDAHVHNLGFCLNEETMYWKHLMGLSFASIIKDSKPAEDWYEKKWLSWNTSRQRNKDLEISEKYRSRIPKAVKNKTKLPEVLV